MVENNSHMKYRCNNCNKIYKDKSGLWYHNNKYHNNKIIQKSANDQPNIEVQSANNQPKVIQSVQKERANVLECKFCNKNYKHIQSRWKHEQKCKNKINKPEINKTEIIELKKELTEGLKEIEKLKVQLLEKINTDMPLTNSSLINNSNNTTSNSNNTSNINNGTINNYIVAFGKENISNILTEQEKCKILNARFKSVEESIKTIHFNEDRPECQNVAITNMRDNLAHIYDGASLAQARALWLLLKPEKKFISKSKQEIINQLIDNHMESIEESLIDYREKLNQKTIEIIETLIDKMNDKTTELYDEENEKKYINYKNYKNDLVKLFVYNESDKKIPNTTNIPTITKKPNKKEIDL